VQQTLSTADVENEVPPIAPPARRTPLFCDMALIEVEIMRLGLDRTSNSHVVILREKNGDRLLPIWIGQPEAESIVIEMHHMHRDRPLTHDLCKQLIVQLGATLRHVSITRVSARTYFAEIHLASRDGGIIVDARPSDSIAIALRFSAPIFAEETLLTAALIEESDDTSSEEETPQYRPMSADELKAYLENMRPEDFGKFHF